MIRGLLLCALVACGRSQGVSDEELGNLVVAPRGNEAKIDVGLAVKDPAELTRALARPHTAAIAALGAHTTAINTSTVVQEGGKPVKELTDHTTIKVGDKGAFSALYSNSGDNGRETIFVGDKLYLRPRYQRWHGRAPDHPGEPAALRDAYYGAVAAAWDLVGFGAELSDRGVVQVAGRDGRKIEVRMTPSPKKPPAERLAQRAWRETRTLQALTGEIVLDAETGVPLSAQLAGTIGFSRDGRHFTMQLKVDSTVSGVGVPAEIAAPPETDVVATPERMREVDDRDFLLDGIAPPLRKDKAP